VLTFSAADKVAREDHVWGQGAFTKVLLDALSANDMDTDHNGVISMTALATYMADHLSQLTGGDKQLGLDQHFYSGIFVAGVELIRMS
jgi:hypothetical protein